MSAIEPLNPTPAGYAGRPAWHTQAACNDGKGTLTSLFYSYDPTEQAAAQAICAGCPVAATCFAEGGDTRMSAFGIWGGVSSATRTRQAKRAAARATNQLSLI